MKRFRDLDWRVKYSPDTCSNIVQEFYIPALQCAVRYWRTTGYFRASALAIAMRGIEGLIQNNGQMRLIVGCTLEQAEAEAIDRGYTLREVVEQHLQQSPLTPPDQAARDALELLAWMIAQSILEVQIAIPCDEHKRPIAGTEIFHEKAGVMEDQDGDRIAFNGSTNETLQGWSKNWDSFHLHTSWITPDHVDEEEQSFVRLWNGRSASAIVIDVPQAIRHQILQFAPVGGELPRRLQQIQWTHLPISQATPIPTPVSAPELEPRKLLWSYISQAPQDWVTGERVGEATCAINPWPHQIRAFKRMWENWPPKLLIADEVGLGKTIQAGLILRQAWLSGRAKRMLIMVPAAVLKQWQVELREKFNLNWPIYDGKSLQWYPSPALQGKSEKPVSRSSWHQEPCILVSSHLMRRQDRAVELLDQAAPWDLIILDEAHHARRSGVQANKPDSGKANRLLSLMQRLKHKTQGLILLTATPMQVDPIEVWDLLNLFDLPLDWTAGDFLRFFEKSAHPAPSDADLAYLARLFRVMEEHFGKINDSLAQSCIPQNSNTKTRKILRALRGDSIIPIKRLETPDRQAAIRIMKAYTPVKVLISRHTRDLLRQYYKAGKLSTPIAERVPKDEFIALSSAERTVYDAVEDYISQTYNNAAAGDRNAVGFVMTIYRKRLASSFYALEKTLSDRLAKLESQEEQPIQVDVDDLPDDNELDEQPDIEEAAQLELAALKLEESSDLRRLLEQVSHLPLDTKTQKLKEILIALQSQGYDQIIVFTQFTDTMDFLRQELAETLNLSIMCFSGRGGERKEWNGQWKSISREETKRRFRNREAEVLLCTDAAAEGLNFQFCGALINYDMPWNPMRVEQRIGRIDRLGQTHTKICIYNLHYADTVETDVFIALSKRIKSFQNFVGRLQPILSALPRAIANLVFSRREERSFQQNILISDLDNKVKQQEKSPFTLEEASELETKIELEENFHIRTPYDLTDLAHVLQCPRLLPPGVIVRSAGSKDFSYHVPGMTDPIRVTTDPKFYDEQSDSVELWSPGNPSFPTFDSFDLVDDVVTLEQFMQMIRDSRTISLSS